MMTTSFERVKGVGVKEGLEILVYVTVIAGIAFTAYGNLSKIPAIASKVDDHEHRISVIETKVDDIHDDVKEILHSVKGGN